MTPVERLRAAEALLREGVENSRKAREVAPVHERAAFDFMAESMPKRGFRVIADIADERIILAMAEVLRAEAEMVERCRLSVTFDGRPMFPARAEHLALADALLGGGGA